MDKKKKNIALIGISVINLIVTIIIYVNLKKMVPINFFANDTIGKMVPKTMLLILPTLSIIISVIQVLFRVKTIDKPVTTAKRVEDGLFAFIDGLVMFSNWILLYISYEFTKTTLVNVEVPIGLIIMGIIGLALAGVYSTFPINKMGSVIGLKTKETMQSEAVWRIANRFNALTGFISAVAIVILAIYFLLFGFNWVYLLLLIVICGILMFYAPRVYAKKVVKDLSERVVE